MQTFEQTFTGATTWKLGIPGSYFTVLSCSNVVNVRLYRAGQLLDLGAINGLLAGLEVLPRRDSELGYAFDYVEVDVSAADTIKVGIGNGEARYNRSAGSVAVTNVNGAFTQTTKTVTNASASMIAANSARRYLLIQNKSATGDIYLNFSGAAATVADGVKIAAGASYELQGYACTGAIFAIGSIASNAEVIAVEG